MQHADVAGHAEDEIEVVLDDQTGSRGSSLSIQRREPRGLRGRHAGRRLVEQQQSRRGASAIATSSWRRSPCDSAAAGRRRRPASPTRPRTRRRGRSPPPAGPRSAAEIAGAPLSGQPDVLAASTYE